MITSPLVPNAPTRPVREIDSAFIIDGYRNEVKFDVSGYFTERSIQVRECEASGYKFYYPLSLVGKESLYRHLQKSDWNYKNEKWEYSRAAELLSPGSEILDVGCGQGAFLAIVSQKGIQGRGLEMNAAAANVAISNGLNVSTEDLSEHAIHNLGRYDAVCSFQVLEHIANVHSYIEDCVSVIKPGGTLIFGVPNNDAFLKYADAVLNMPPHHMGLWDHRSLTALANIFDLQIESIEMEPLAEIDWYTSVMERRLIPRQMRSVYFRLGLARLYKFFVRHFAKYIHGHTVLAVYRKL